MNVLPFILLAVSTLILTLDAAAQNFVSRSFAAYSDNDVAYTTATRFNGALDTLRMNIFYPVNDGSTSRPCIVWVHGGGFTGGNRNEMNELAQTWAERGYVSVTISYRLGFYGAFPLDAPFAYDQAEVVRACFRAVQDLRSALRFLVYSRERYRIDTARMIIGGGSAGAITALHAAYYDSADSLPVALGAVGPVVRGLETFQRPPLGPIDGAAPPDGSALPSLRAVVNIFGAVTSLNILGGAPFVPTFSYHQRNDRVVACGTEKGLWGLPLNVGANYPTLHGSCALQSEFERRGIPAQLHKTLIYNGADHAVNDAPFVDSVAAVFCARILATPTSVCSKTVLSEEGLRDYPASVFDTRGNLALTARDLGELSLLPSGVYALVADGTRPRVFCVQAGIVHFRKP